MASELFDAIEQGNADAVAALLDDGADPNELRSDEPGWTPLHQAINELEDGGPIDALVLLLRYGARVEGNDGDTPLLMALYRSQPRAVDLLLARGADANVRGPEGDSPLRVCAERGDVATAAALLRCGATATIDEAGGPAGASALGIAAMRLDTQMIALLLRWGAGSEVGDTDRRVARDRLPQRTVENAQRWDEAEGLLRASSRTL